MRSSFLAGRWKKCERRLSAEPPIVGEQVVRPNVAAFSTVLGLLLLAPGCDTDDEQTTDTDPSPTDPSSTSGTTDAPTSSSTEGRTRGSTGSEDSSGSDSGSSTGDPSAFEHCVADPPSDSDMNSGAWADVDGDVIVTPSPVDFAAGGYVLATLAPGSARGAIEVSLGGEDVAGGVEGDPGDPVDIGFLAAPAATYTIEGRQAASSPSYPTTWVLNWSVIPIPDCWEPNQNPAQAAAIAFDAEIRGYINAGYESGDPPLTEDYYDYYVIEADTPGVLDVRMDEVPDDGLLRVAVFDAADEPIGPLIGVEEMGQPFSGTVPILEAGTYYIQVNTLLAPTLRFADDEDVPDSWTTPYRFTLGFTAD